MNYFLLSLSGILLAALMGRVITPRILLISIRKRLFDVPDARKIHNHPIPRLGGVTFFPVILFVLCVLTAFRVMLDDFSNNPLFTVNIVTEMLALFAGLTLLYIVGIGDDLIGVSYRKKFLIQILAASFLPICGLSINSFYGLFGIHAIPALIGIPLTVLLVVFITNAINLIDGIDGLASSICIVALGVLGFIFSISELWMYAQLAFICLGVLIPFFMYNVFGNPDRGRKIFMGDTGSLTLGYILSFLIVKYCIYTGSSLGESGGDSLTIAFSILLVPCLDVIRVVLGRLRRRKSPFQPDKTHIHHKFMAMGFGPHYSLILIQLISLAIISVTIYSIHIGINATCVFIIDVIIWTVLNLWFTYVVRKKTTW